MNISKLLSDNLQSRILDEMSDGQWHPVYKLNKRIERGDAKAKEFKKILADNLQALSDRGILLAGNNESYRFKGDTLEKWRSSSTNPALNEKQYQPRYFGGILEDDGWLLAELKNYDLIHFRAEPTLERTHIQKKLNIDLNSIQIEEGLYRILLSEGAEQKIELVRELQNEEPIHAISGIRLELNLKRRDTSELPEKYLSDLVKYYGQFSKILLRSHMTSIIRHMPDQDDIQQQIYLWVLDAVQRYDANTSIPFAAYLGTLLKKWVFNLNRKSFGRAVADVELKHNRAINAFRLEHSRQPTQEELAEILDQSEDSVKKDMSIISTVSNLRNISSINNDENETQLPSEATVDESIEALAKNTLLSAALTTATRKVFSEKKSIDCLIVMYYTTWGQEYNSKRLKTWARTAKNQENARHVRTTMANILKDEEI